MPRRDTRISLLQMRDHAQEALAMVEGRTRADVDSDRMLNLALARLLEILGEAANRVPAEDIHRSPGLSWSAYGTG